MKTKQITDISLRTFENTTTADAWIATYNDPSGANNELVFNGLQYNNKEDGKKYEAIFTTTWHWEEVILDIGDIVVPESELGGANLFIIAAQGINGALADPQFDQEIIAIDPAATVAVSIKVDDREDSISPNVDITIETDGGKEYVTDYFILDATNEDTSTGGLPVIGAINKTDMLFIGANTNDRRFRSDIGAARFSSKPGGVEVTQIRIAGNGGQSILIPILRAAPVSSATSVDNFTVENSATPNHTHVRDTQTYSLDFHFNLTTLLGPDNIAQSDATFPTIIELTGDAVNGIYSYTIPVGDRPTEYGTATDFIVIVAAIPAHTTTTSDAGVVSYVTINAEKTTSNSADFTAAKVDNTLPTISGGVLSYPTIPGAARFGSITQKAIRTFDIPARAGTVNTIFLLDGVDFGTGGTWSITEGSSVDGLFSTSTTGDQFITGSADVTANWIIDGIPSTGAATVTNAFTIVLNKAKIGYTITKDVEVRYQQNDLTATGGTRIGRDPGFTRTYTFNYESLASVVESSLDAVVPNGNLLVTSATTADLAVTIAQFATTRQVYTYQFYAVGESGFELDEVIADNESIEAKGFSLITMDLTASNIVGPGPHNDSISVPNNSYEIDLQDITIPGIGTGTLTVVDPLNLIATNGPAGIQTTYSAVGSQWVYIDNTVGTQIVTMTLEETV